MSAADPSLDVGRPAGAAETAWDTLLHRLDVAAHGGDLPSAVELTGLLEAAQVDGLADGELDAVDSGLWLASLAATQRDLAVGGPGDDRALSTARVIVTRWLHPPRLDLAERAAGLVPGGPAL